MASDLLPGSVEAAAKLPGVGQSGSVLDRLVARYIRQLLRLGVGSSAAAKAAWLAAQRSGERGTALSEPLVVMADERRARAIEMAGVFFRAAAKAQGVDVSGVVLPSPSQLSRERAAAAFDSAGAGVLGLARKRGASTRVGERKAADAVGATMDRLVVEAARQAVAGAAQTPSVEAVAREQGVGQGSVGRDLSYLRVTRWARVTTSPEPCAFCVMLASRGAVYKSEAGAKGFNSHQYHDNCHCIVVPVFGSNVATEQSDAYYELWQQATSGYSGREALNAFRSKLRESRNSAQVA